MCYSTSVLVLFSTFVALAADTPKAAKQQDKFDGLIFNGKDLNGWRRSKHKNPHGTGGRWTVTPGATKELGVLSGEQDPPGSGNGGIFVTDQKFADFVLSLEMKPDWGIDSGIILRASEHGGGFQIFVDHHDSGNIGHLRVEIPEVRGITVPLRPFHFDGILDANGRPVAFKTRIDDRTSKWPAKGVYKYSCPPEDWLRCWKVGAWNKIRIRCVGKYPQIITWINGTKIFDFDASTCTHPGFHNEEILRALGPAGSIGFQVHRGARSWPKGKKCNWRNIHLKEL